MVWWIWLLVGVFAGALIGGIVAFALARRSGDAGEIRRLERELERYRGDVSDHFVRTAELVNTLTSDYRAVYEHLERGAYDLVGDAELRRRLKGIEAEPVTLEYIGQRRLAPTSGPAQRSDGTGGDAERDPAGHPAGSGADGAGHGPGETDGTADAARTPS